MGRVAVKVKLRPVRMAFLVKPNDGKALLQVLRVNSSLWGGKFNPIIPYFKKTPAWWDRHHRSSERAGQILNGYLDRFEPDFLVETESGMASTLGFNSKRILNVSDVLGRAHDPDVGVGMNVFSLFKDLYLKEFQFQRRHQHHIVDATAAQKPYQNFVACLFGSFPIEEGLAYIGEAFKDAFDPTPVSIDGPKLAELYQSHFTTALTMGHDKLDIEHYGWRDQTIFVLDAQNTMDIIDYWNLRIVKSDVVPVPVQWMGDLSGHCADVLKRAIRPMRGNPQGLMHMGNVMFARSIKTAQIEAVSDQYLPANIQHSRQDWYPSYWRPSQSGMPSIHRASLSASEKSFDLPFSDEAMDIRFDSLHPDFAERFGGRIRWANVVSVRDWSLERNVSTIAPTDYRDPTYRPFRLTGDILLPTTEGLVIFPHYKDIQNYWTLQDGTTAISSWLKSKDIISTLSDAGRATQQIVQTLGGFHGVRNLANKGVLDLLNQISRRPVNKSMKYAEFTNKVNIAVKGNIWMDGAAEQLVKRNAVELGIQVKCSKCSSTNWFSLSQLQRRVTCALCLRDFEFPTTNPDKNTDWAYRLIGPFALPDYAQGGYAAALAIRFFTEVLGRSDVQNTWSPGQELVFPSGQRSEADFIIWYERTRTLGLGHPTQTVFGEAKSFGKLGQDVFLADDVSRMRELAEFFPGSVLVFATLRTGDQLTKSEVQRIKALAEWGRQPINNSNKSRARVILLTGTELFTGFDLSTTWKEMGGRHAELVSGAYLRLEKLGILAELTQELYLGMQPYYEYRMEKIKRKINKAKNP